MASDLPGWRGPVAPPPNNPRQNAGGPGRNPSLFEKENDNEDACFRISLRPGHGLYRPAFAGSNVGAYVGDMMADETAAKAPDKAAESKALKREARREARAARRDASS